MEIGKAYRKMLEILNEYYYSVESEGYDELADMMFDIDIEVWKQPKDENEIISNDPVAFKDFKRSWNKIVGNGKDGTDKQLFEVTKIAFFDYYQNDVKYYLADAEKYLREKLLKE